VQIDDEIRYDADPSTVFVMLTDHAFQDRKLGQTGAVRWEVQVRQENGGAVITSRRAMPTDQVPDAFKSMIGPTLDISQVETWSAAAPDGSRTGSLDVQVAGAPVGMKATLSLSATAGGGSLQLVNGELKARIPLVGGRVERAAEPAVRAAIEAEQRIGQAWLAER
jgi:Protein of unknown function (DUF2505)